MGHHPDEAAASNTEPHPARPIDRRAMLRRLAVTGAVAWVAPEVLATRRASAMAHSGCYTEYGFDDGTLQGWSANGQGPARWQLSTLHSFTGSHSVWFGRRNSSDSLHPIAGQPSYRGGNGSRGTLTSPATTVSSTDMVAFTVRLAIENAVQYDVFTLSIVQGSTRVTLWDKQQGGFSVIDHPENPSTQWDLYTTFGNWVPVSVTIGAPPGIDLTSAVQFEFDFQTVDRNYNRTEGIYLDAISIPCTATTVRSTSRNAGLTLEAPVSSGYLPGYQPPAKARKPQRDR